MELIGKIGLAFTQGGMWMWVILALQIVAIAIVFERIISLYFLRKSTETLFVNQFENDIRKGNLQEVLTKSKNLESDHPVARAIRAGAQAALNLGGKEEIQGKMDEILLEENSRIEKRTGFLSMLANVGTLTGLLGTIVGMIKSFSAVTFASPMEKAALLSTGISEAMNTTAYGLIMAIPALIMYAVLTNRATQLTDDINRAALKVFNWLSYSYDPVPIKSSQGNTNK